MIPTHAHEGIEKLSDEHADHLTNIAEGGLMRIITPDDVESHFLKHGYIRKAVGGLMITDAGYHALEMYKKENGE